MLIRTAAGALLISGVLLAPAEATADDPDGGNSYFTGRTDNKPGVETVINSPSDKSASDRPARDGDATIYSDTVELGPCSGNIGASSFVDGDRLREQLAACVGTEPEGVDAAAEAAQVRDRMALTPPEIHTSPEDPNDAIVGLETWMWVPPRQWEALKDSKSLGGTTIRVRAEPIATVWDMGEGQRTCEGPGRVWRKGLGQEASTRCGYTYRHTSLGEPDEKYTISGRIRYGVSWTCEGNCWAPNGGLGTIDSTASTAPLEVGERQSVVTIQ